MKKALLTVWIIVILLLTNLVCLYFLLKPRTTVHTDGIVDSPLSLAQIETPYFNQPVDEKSAINNVAAFRNNLNLKSNGVLYDADTIFRYLQTTYPQLKKNMCHDTTGYTWKIGFYWMITKGKDSVNRLAFCVVPTLVSLTNSSILCDYFNDTKKIYTHPDTTGSTGLNPDAQTPPNAYDEGQLWP